MKCGISTAIWETGDTKYARRETTVNDFGFVMLFLIKTLLDKRRLYRITIRGTRQMILWTYLDGELLACNAVAMAVQTRMNPDVIKKRVGNPLSFTMSPPMKAPTQIAAHVAR